MESNKKPFLPQSKTGRIVLAVLLIVGLLGSVGAYRGVSNLVAASSSFGFIGDPVLPNPTQAPDAPPGELPTPTMGAPDAPVLPPAWDGKTRVNMLVMGLDARDLADQAPHTDTMILFTLDPLNNTAGIISIPRDLWTNIPGFGYERINTAYRFGILNQLPGGGPALAAKTVETLLGVPVHYYAQIDFAAFVAFIDDIKGVKIENDESVQLDFVGTARSYWLEPGKYTLPGEDALAYVRSRSTAGGDFDRAKRQQKVILAIRDRILEFDMLPHLIMNSQKLYDDLSAGIKTNLSLVQATQLAVKVFEVDRDAIQHYVIDGPYVNFGRGPGGEQVLRPIPDKIRELRDQVFSSGGTAAPAQQATLQSYIQQESAAISVRNASATTGIEVRTAEYLRNQGLNIVEEVPTTYLGYTRITIVGAKPYTVRYLVDLFKIPSASFQVVYAYDPAATTHIVLEVGDDWAQNNPMP